MLLRLTRKEEALIKKQAAKVGLPASSYARMMLMVGVNAASQKDKKE